MDISSADPDSGGLSVLSTNCGRIRWVAVIRMGNTCPFPGFRGGNGQVAGCAASYSVNWVGWPTQMLIVASDLPLCTT